MQNTPLCKLSKKARQAFYAGQRGSWNGVNPVTRIRQSDRSYDRNRAKQALRRTGGEG